MLERQEVRENHRSRELWPDLPTKFLFIAEGDDCSQWNPFLLAVTRISEMIDGSSVPIAVSTLAAFGQSTSGSSSPAPS